MRCIKFQLTALACALLTFGLSAQAAEVRVATLPGSGWLITDQAPAAGWTSVGYDTSGWVAPTVLTGLEAITSTRINPPAGEPAARLMWMGNVDGSGSPDHVFMRTEFSLASFAMGQALNALVYVQADDDYAFYINGLQVLLNNDQGHADLIQVVSVGNYLIAGQTNVFAIEAVDGGWGNPSDRVFQDIQLDARISPEPIVGTVPEPASMALTLLGLGSLAGLRRRKAS